MANPPITLRVNDRVSIVGKSGSGKTALMAMLAGVYAMLLPPPWQVWVVDTKGSPDDLELFRAWGFRNAFNVEDRATSPLMNAVYFKCSGGGAGRKYSIKQQANSVLAAAYERQYVVVVVDEFAQVAENRVSSGPALDDVFFRGRGLNIGFIGGTQEPVNIPRNLFSQATHTILMRLTWRNDIKAIRDSFDWYTPPPKYAFYWIDVDGTEQISYYESQQELYQKLLVDITESTLTKDDIEIPDLKEFR